MSSSADLDDFLALHTVSVRTYTGTTGQGAKDYAAAVDVDGFVTRKRTLVRDQDGQQTMASASFSTDAANASKFTPGTLVTITGDQPAVVITVQVTDGGDVVPGLDRCKVWLQ